MMSGYHTAQSREEAREYWMSGALETIVADTLQARSMGNSVGAALS